MNKILMDNPMYILPSTLANFLFLDTNATVDIYANIRVKSVHTISLGAGHSIRTS